MQRCECDVNAMNNPNPVSWYEPEERKAMKHKPNECPGDYQLKQYNRDGKILTLCSCCVLTNDVDVEHA